MHVLAEGNSSAVEPGRIVESAGETGQLLAAANGGMVIESILDFVFDFLGRAGEDG